MGYKQIREKFNQYVKKQANDLCGGLGDKLTINLTMPSTRKTAVGLLALTGCTTPIVYEGNHFRHYQNGSEHTNTYSQGTKAHVVKKIIINGKCTLRSLITREQTSSSKIRTTKYDDMGCDWQVNYVTIREGDTDFQNEFRKRILEAHRDSDGLNFHSHTDGSEFKTGSIDKFFKERIGQLFMIRENQTLYERLENGQKWESKILKSLK